MYKRILIPIDGSESAWKALSCASSLGENFQAALMVVHVEPYRGSAVPLAPILRPDVERGEHQLLSAAKKRLENYPYGVTLKLELGHPAERILSLAEAWQADLIIIGRRGLSNIAGFLMGSVSNAVLQYAHIPVLVVKDKGEQKEFSD